VRRTSKAGQTSLEALMLMSAMMMMFSMLLYTAKIEDQRLASRNAGKRAQIIANKLAFALEHACDGGAHNTEYVQIFTWSRHLVVKYREETIKGKIVKGIEVEAPRWEGDKMPPIGAAYITGPHFTSDSIGWRNPTPSTFNREPITCGNVLCGSIRLKVQCRHGYVRLFSQNATLIIGDPGGGGAA